MKVDLNWFFRNYNPDSPHHIAAVNELARHLPPDQLDFDAEWINTFEAEEMELNYNRYRPS